MSAVTASLCTALLFLGVFVFVSTDHHKITIRAETGQCLTLPCRAPNSRSRAIKSVEWRFRNASLFGLPFYKHKRFPSRLVLKDRQTKNGEGSLILKDVTINDAGRYECLDALGAKNQRNTRSIIIFYLIVFPPVQKITIKAEDGHDIALPCQAPNNRFKPTKGVECRKADMEFRNVFLFQNSHFAPDNQHPSFKNRVDLQDRQMKDGGVSLILKDVTINDAGTYECRVFMEETRSWELISIIYLRVDPLNQKAITALCGEDVTLTCQAPDNKIDVVEWRRADLGDAYVLLYRDEQFDSEGQHPSFKNRVDLRNKQMKDGDVSLILKNVTIIDAATYECHVFMRESHLRNLMKTIYLRVVAPAVVTFARPLPLMRQVTMMRQSLAGSDAGSSLCSTGSVSFQARMNVTEQ